MSKSDLVLVTGGSGFLGAHCILKLLEAGYRVRTTVRSLKREPEVRAMLKEGGAEPGDRLEFAEADLTSDKGWPEAVAGCAYVLHVASPLPLQEPKDEQELIGPAREGALRVLRAAKAAGAKRVVLTSSFAAIGYGHPPRATPFTETDWTNVEQAEGAYIKSKALAERAAWDYVAGEGKGLELAVINPVIVLGPVLGPDSSASIELVKTMLEGRLKGLPKLTVGIVDVRDVADLHLLAMTGPAAKGERLLSIAGDCVTLEHIARTLKARMGPAAAKVSTRVLPNWVVRVAALFSATAKQAASRELGKPRSVSNAKARKLLGWEPRSPEDAAVATAESLVRLGLLKV